MMKSILPPLLRQCPMRRHHVIVTLTSCRRRSSNFPPLVDTLGAKGTWFGLDIMSRGCRRRRIPDDPQIVSARRCGGNSACVGPSGQTLRKKGFCRTSCFAVCVCLKIPSPGSCEPRRSDAVGFGRCSSHTRATVRCGRPEASQKKNSTERQKAAV